MIGNNPLLVTIYITGNFIAQFLVLDIIQQALWLKILNFARCGNELGSKYNSHTVCQEYGLAFNVNKASLI